MKKKITNNSFAVALYEITAGLHGEKLHEALHQFVLLLVKYHKLKQGARIIAEFEKYAKKQAGVVEIEITSARKLSETTLNHIKKVFSTKGGSASGPKAHQPRVEGGGVTDVESTEKVDALLLGGMKVKTEDKILDGSLKTQLLNLKQSLI